MAAEYNRLRQAIWTGDGAAATAHHRQFKRNGVMTMNETVYLEDSEDFDSDELTPAMRAQLRRFEHDSERRLEERSRIRARRRDITSRLEDWKEARRLRDEVDYLH